MYLICNREQVISAFSLSLSLSGPQFRVYTAIYFCKIVLDPSTCILNVIKQNNIDRGNVGGW